MSNDEVIERKLLIDGDGAGDDRRLNIMLKMFLKWSNTKYDDPNECVRVKERILTQINLCELAMKKSQAVSSMTDEEMLMYDKMFSEIDCEIEKTKDGMAQTNELLKKAKITKRNQMEYDVLVKQINQHPPRDKTTQLLADLKDEVDTIKKTKGEVDKAIDKKREKLQVLTLALNALEESSDENNSESEDVSHKAVDDKNLTISTKKE